MNINIFLLAIIIANVLVSIKGFSNRYFFDKYKFQISPIKNGQQMRMFTSGFLHVDYLHLFLNMYVLYIFAPYIIGNLGVIKFLIIYFGSLLAGSTFTLSWHKNEPYYSAVGASGAVAGIIYATIMLNPTMSLLVFPIPLPIPGYVFALVYLLYTIYGMKKQIGNIGHAAHLGGSIGGYVIILLLTPGIINANPKLVVLLGIPIALVLLFGHKLK